MSQKIYIYGFELLLSSAVGIFSLMILSVLVGKPFSWISYLAGFIPLRITGGGYHAKSHFACILSFSFWFLLLLALSNILCLIPYIHLILAGISLGISYFFAPVEAINKPLSAKNRLRNRRRCLSISWINVLASGIILIFGMEHMMHITMYFVGTFSAGISMIATLPSNRVKADDNAPSESVIRETIR